MISSSFLSLAVNGFSRRRVTSMNSVSWLSFGNYITCAFCFSLYIGSWNLYCISLAVYTALYTSYHYDLYVVQEHSAHLTSTATSFSRTEVILQKFVYLYIAGHYSLKEPENRKCNDFKFLILHYLGNCCLCIKVLWYQSAYGLPKGKYITSLSSLHQN